MTANNMPRTAATHATGTASSVEARPPIVGQNGDTPTDVGPHYASHLTAHDRTVVFHATGVRVSEHPVGGVPLLAMQIGLDRRGRVLPPDVHLSISYFQALQARADEEQPDPFRGAVQRAIDFLTHNASDDRLNLDA